MFQQNYKRSFLYFISASFNNAVNKGVFADKLKQADIKPIYKKGSRNEKENYRPVSILPNLPKIFERWMYERWIFECMINIKTTLISYCQNISADLEKV